MAHIGLFENETRTPTFTLHTEKVVSTAKYGIILDSEGKEVGKDADNTLCSKELSLPDE